MAGLLNRGGAGLGVRGEACDRCGAPGRVRVGKYIVPELTLPPACPDAPRHVPASLLDLVFCGVHYARHEPRLRDSRWHTLDDRR